MKQLLTLSLAVFCFSATFAQSTTTEKAKRVIRNERRDYDPARSHDENERDVAMGGSRRPVYDDDRDYRYGNNSRTGEINREYDAKIRSIRNNPKLSRSEKAQIIRGLEAERDRRIREVNGSYGNDRRYAERSKEGRSYNDGYKKYKNKKRYKEDNGKHRGWQKGKGNPHRWD